MFAISWHDRHQVNMQTTVHKGEMVDTERKDRRTGEIIKQPDAIVDDNVNMRLVDKSDMQVGSIECIRQCGKWYKKTFLHLIDIVVLNAYNLYLVTTGKRVSLRIFSKTIIEKLLEKYGVVQAATPRRNLQAGQPDRILGQDYISHHFLELLRPAPGKPKAQTVPCVQKQHEASW